MPAWFDDGFPRTQRVAAGTPSGRCVLRVCAGAYHSVALCDDGSVVRIGDGGYLPAPRAAGAGESTGEGKSLAPEINSRYHVLYGSTSFSEELADRGKNPYMFVS